MCSFSYNFEFVRNKIPFLIIQLQLKLNMSDTLGPKIWDILPQRKIKNRLIPLKLLLKHGSQIDVLAGFVKLICKTLDTCRGNRIIFMSFLSFLSIFLFLLMQPMYILLNQDCCSSAIWKCCCFAEWRLTEG